MIIELSITDFLKKLGMGEPVPGSGSAAFLCGAMGAALCAMVSNISCMTPADDQDAEPAKSIISQSLELQNQLTVLIDDEYKVIAALIQALNMPDDSEKTRGERAKAVEKESRNLILLYMQSMHLCCETLSVLKAVVVNAPENTFTDLGSAALLCGASAQSAALNVNANLTGIRNREWAKERFTDITRMLAEVKRLSDEILKSVTHRTEKR